jgi:hypothetical protein
MRVSNLFLVAVLFAGHATANTVYYDNTSPANDTLTDIDFSVGYNGIGDSITIEGSGLAVTDAFAEFYNDGTDGTFDATLAFFQAGSPVGSQIGGSYTVTGIAAAAGTYENVDFALGSVNLPTNFVFVLEVANLTEGVDPGVELYNDPTNVGSNTANTAVVLQSSAYSQQDTTGGNPYFQLASITPEPSTWLLAAVGLSAVLWRKRRA